MIRVLAEAGKNIKDAAGGNVMQVWLQDLEKRIFEMRDYL